MLPTHFSSWANVAGLEFWLDRPAARPGGSMTPPAARGGSEPQLCMLWEVLHQRSRSSFFSAAFLNRRLGTSQTRRQTAITSHAAVLSQATRSPIAGVGAPDCASSRPDQYSRRCGRGMRAVSFTALPGEVRPGVRQPCSTYTSPPPPQRCGAGQPCAHPQHTWAFAELRRTPEQQRSASDTSEKNSKPL